MYKSYGGVVFANVHNICIGFTDEEIQAWQVERSASSSNDNTKLIDHVHTDTLINAIDEETEDKPMNHCTYFQLNKGEGYVPSYDEYEIETWRLTLQEHCLTRFYERFANCGIQSLNDFRKLDLTRLEQVERDVIGHIRLKHKKYEQMVRNVTVHADYRSVYYQSEPNFVNNNISNSNTNNSASTINEHETIQHVFASTSNDTVCIYPTSCDCAARYGTAKFNVTTHTNRLTIMSYIT